MSRSNVMRQCTPFVRHNSQLCVRAATKCIAQTLCVNVLHLCVTIRSYASDRTHYASQFTFMRRSRHKMSRSNVMRQCAPFVRHNSHLCVRAATKCVTQTLCVNVLHLCVTIRSYASDRTHYASQFTFMCQSHRKMRRSNVMRQCTSFVRHNSHLCVKLSLFF
ncbi:hypothetical protein ACUXCC_002348 [Cytobacillus horneckiae]